MGFRLGKALGGSPQVYAPKSQFLHLHNGYDDTPARKGTGEDKQGGAYEGTGCGKHCPPSLTTKPCGTLGRWSSSPVTDEDTDPRLRLRQRSTITHKAV